MGRRRRRPHFQHVGWALYEWPFPKCRPDDPGRHAEAVAWHPTASKFGCAEAPDRILWNIHSLSLYTPSSFRKNTICCSLINSRFGGSLTRAGGCVSPELPCLALKTRSRCVCHSDLVSFLAFKEILFELATPKMGWSI